MWPLLPTEAAAQETTAHTAPAPAVDAHLLTDAGAGLGGLGGIVAILLTLERVGVISLPRRGQQEPRNGAEITAISTKVDALTQRMSTMETTLAAMTGTDQLHAHRLDEMRQQITETRDDVRAARDDIRRAVDLLASRS